jgi:hypothetical protein
MAADVNLVVNGSFETHVVSHRAGWNVYRSLPGWTLTSGPNIELQRGILGGAADGAQHVELDSDQNGHAGKNPKKERGSSSITSAPITVEPGRVYELTYQAKARPGTGAADNILGVNVQDGGTKSSLHASVHQLTPGAGWQTFKQTIQPVGSQLTLTFGDRGVNNTLGTFLDNVQLKALPVSGDLDILLNNQPVEEGVELNPGAKITLNEDDDNLNGVPDSADQGTVANENDLVPLVLRQAVNSGYGASYALEFDSTSIRVWKDQTRTALVTSGAFEFNANTDTLLYAEAISYSPYNTSAETFRLLWKSNQNAPSTVLDEVGLQVEPLVPILASPVTAPAKAIASHDSALLTFSANGTADGYGWAFSVSPLGDTGEYLANSANSATGSTGQTLEQWLANQYA